jgi:hypothetical protein
MDIILCNTSSEGNEINKELTNSILFGCTLRAETSILEPSVLLESQNNLSVYNYCYIPEFARYYYIADVLSVRNNLWLLKCKVDVLMSFKDSIFESYAIIEESTETGISNYLNNDVWVNLVKDKTDILQFPNGLLENGEYILITAGGL